MASTVDRFSSSSPSYRRMATSCLVTIVANSREPSTTSEWLVQKLLGLLNIIYEGKEDEYVPTDYGYFADVGCQSHARSPSIQGVLLTFQQLCTQSVLSYSALKLVGWW